jgi:GNAT superfamily N-acetyltransferase
MDVLIRKAGLSDVDLVYDLMLQMIEAEDSFSERIGAFLMEMRWRKADFAEAAKIELCREFEEADSLFLGAEYKGKVVGYARGSVIEQKDPFFETRLIGEVNAICVSEEHRGKGIASQLYHSLEDWFRARGCVQVHLEVVMNNPATAVYENWGFLTFSRKMAKRL